MRQNYSYLKDVAYYPYIPGLQKAGLTIEKIPDLQDMNNALAKIGWGAVTVDGFIPCRCFYGVPGLPGAGYSCRYPPVKTY
jgi:phenylalanine-4-hydroxylase